MRINTIEDDFSYQAEEILKEALEGFYDIETNNLDKFESELWKAGYVKEIGRKFLEKLAEYDGQETLEKVFEYLQNKNK